MNALRAIFLGLLVVLLPQLRGQSLQFSSVFGGSGSPITEIFTVNTNFDVPQKIAVDVLGNIYVTGTAFSTDFPLVRPLTGSTASTAQTGVPFVSKLDPTGTKLLYSTFIGPPQYASSAVGERLSFPLRSL